MRALILLMVLAAPAWAQTVVGLPNPSAVFCEDSGGSYMIVDSDAGQSGVCQLADGTKVEAWAYFRANSAATSELANPAATFCDSLGGTYAIRSASDGSKTGICTLQGVDFDAWGLFRAAHPKQP